MWRALCSARQTRNTPGLVSFKAEKAGQELSSDCPETSLPYVASEGDLSDLLVLQVQGESVRLFFCSRFITNSEDGPKVNAKIWNLHFTGQSHSLPVILEGHSSFRLLHT